MTVNIYVFQYYIPSTENFQQMNISPSRTPNLPINQPIQPPKPKIAFTYQFASTLTSPNNVQNQLQQDTCSRHTNQIPLYQYTDLTPRKHNDKQNNHYPSAANLTGQGGVHNVGIGKYGNIRRNQNLCYKSNLGINNGDLNGTNSPTSFKSKPPLSPKLSNQIKKNNNQEQTHTVHSHSRCPSFLSQKSARSGSDISVIHSGNNNEVDSKSVKPQQSKNLTLNVICTCGNPATHRYNKTQSCCSKCGINKMLQGHQLQAIPLAITQPNPQTHLQPSKPQTTTQQPISLTLSLNTPTLLQAMKSQKQSLIQQHKQLQQINNQQKENIHKYYKEKKQQLKIHYERIKSAIKESIQLDLESLEIMEKQQLEYWKKGILDVEDGIRKLEKLEKEGKEGVEAWKVSVVEELQNVSRIKRSRLSKNVLVTETDTLNISTLSTPSHNSSIILAPQSRIFCQNMQAYKTQIYRMVGNPVSLRTQRSGRTSEVSACSQLWQTSQISSPGYQSPSSRLKVCKQEQMPRKSDIHNEKKDVLFSFQGQK